PTPSWIHFAPQREQKARACGLRTITILMEWQSGQVAMELSFTFDIMERSRPVEGGAGRDPALHAALLDFPPRALPPKLRFERVKEGWFLQDHRSVALREPLEPNGPSRSTVPVALILRVALSSRPSGQA